MPRICWILILFGALERELLLVFLEIAYICSRLQKRIYIYIDIYFKKKLSLTDLSSLMWWRVNLG